MGKKLTATETYRSLARINNKYSVESFKEMYETLNEFIVDELLRFGYVDLPNLGRIKLILIDGHMGHVPSSNPEIEGKTKMIYIEPYYTFKFTSTEIFKQNINNGRPPRAELKRERERYRAESQKEKNEQRIKELLKNEPERLEKAREKAEERRKKRKELYRMSKKKRAELEYQEKLERGEIEENQYDYGNLEE